MLKFWKKGVEERVGKIRHQFSQYWGNHADYLLCDFGYNRLESKHLTYLQEVVCSLRDMKCEAFELHQEYRSYFIFTKDKSSPDYEKLDARLELLIKRISNELGRRRSSRF